jgi:hypothetical protein
MQLRQWFRDQRIANANKAVLIPLRGRAASLDLLNPTCRANWKTWLSERCVEYLIVDCLRPVLDALGLDESREAGRWLVGFDALLREAGISEACIVHHMGHSGERSRGDSRLRDWPDAEWRVVRKDGDDDSPRYISAYGRDVNVAEAELSYEASTRRVRLVGGSREEAKAAKTLDAISELLTAGGEALSGRRIKDALKSHGHSKDTIDKALRIGIKGRRLEMARGPKNALLYRVSECSAVSGGQQGTDCAFVSECPTASIEAVTQDATITPTTFLYDE